MGRQVALEKLVVPPTRSVHVIRALNVAVDEAKGFLSAVQYQHALDLVMELRNFRNPEAKCRLSLRPIGSLWEIRDKGGVLGKINLRIFFAYLPKSKEALVVGAIKKEAEAQTPRHIVIRMEDRLDDYLEATNQLGS